MLCKIADLLVEVPEEDGMGPRCGEYLYKEPAEAEVILHSEYYNADNWPGLTREEMVYMESGIQFYVNLLHHDGMMLHASGVEMDGAAFLFSGQCGAGKSTHTELWQKTFGEKAQVFNDDKPALRYMDGRWYAYGTPWSGKNGINQNKKIPLAGICFLKQAKENSIRRLSTKEALSQVFSQTLFRFRNPENLEKMFTQVEKLVTKIPIFELENRPEPEAAHLSHETMLRAAKEEVL